MPVGTDYPSQLQALLGPNYQVTNLGKAGTTVQAPFRRELARLPMSINRPYRSVTQYAELTAGTWDIVVIMMGTNDGKLYRVTPADEEFDTTPIIITLIITAILGSLAMIVLLATYYHDRNTIVTSVTKKVCPRETWSDLEEQTQDEARRSETEFSVHETDHPKMAFSGSSSSREHSPTASATYGEDSDNVSPFNPVQPSSKSEKLPAPTNATAIFGYSGHLVTQQTKSPHPIERVDL